MRRRALNDVGNTPGHGCSLNLTSAHSLLEGTRVHTRSQEMRSAPLGSEANKTERAQALLIRVPVRPLLRASTARAESGGARDPLSARTEALPRRPNMAFSRMVVLSLAALLALCAVGTEAARGDDYPQPSPPTPPPSPPPPAPTLPAPPPPSYCATQPQCCASTNTASYVNSASYANKLLATDPLPTACPLPTKYCNCTEGAWYLGRFNLKYPIGTSYLDKTTGQTLASSTSAKPYIAGVMNRASCCAACSNNNKGWGAPCCATTGSTSCRLPPSSLRAAHLRNRPLQVWLLHHLPSRERPPPATATQRVPSRGSPRPGRR